MSKPGLKFKNREELDRAMRHVSRRNFIEGGMSAAILAAAAVFYPPDVAAQARYRLRRKPTSAGTGARTVITSANIQFNGFHRFPDASGSSLQNITTNSEAVMSVTYSAERGTWFTIGGTAKNQQFLYEMALPSEAATLNPETAPILTVLANWGQYTSAALRPTTENSWTIAHIHYDSYSDGIYTWYNVGYQLDNSPTLLWTSLSGTAAERVAGTASQTTVGGWRNNINAWTMWGGPFVVPQDWADTYLDGAPIAFNGARSKSGVGHSHGVGLTTSDLHLFDPANTPTDPGGGNTANGTAYSITSARKIWLTGGDGEKIVTNTTSKICGNLSGSEYPAYTCPYDPDTAPIQDSTHFFGTQQIDVGETDSIPFALFFDNGTKWGIINFASLADTPTGYMSTIVANGWDDDGIVHRGYANYARGSLDVNGDVTTWPNSTCCHGQVDSTWQSTGPWTPCREKFLYLYSPDTYAASIATGNLAHMNGTAPDETINLRTMMETAMGTTIPYTGSGSFNEGFGGAMQIGNKIYMTIRKFEDSRNAQGGSTGTKVYRSVLAEYEIV
jgi:hypothetical protein